MIKIRSKTHRRYIASLPCVVGGYWNETVISHHLLRAGGKATGTKACDSLLIPLTNFNHQQLHSNGNEVVFLSNNGVDYLHMLHWLKEINQGSPDKRIRESTAVDKAIEFYIRLRG